VISPLVSNLFLHYAFDRWMRQTYPAVPFERYADDAVVHCRTEAEAQRMMQAIAQRLAECGLELHPEKTKIVYCKDGQRKLNYPLVKFDFLGFSFQPRQAKNRWGGLFLNFSPAVSAKAAKSIRHTIRSWKIHRWTQLTIEEIAARFNPVLRGWVNYYGSYYRSLLAPVLGQLDFALVRWARRKYKRLKGSATRARAWVKRIARQHPALFVHWGITHPGMAER
jgi:RNA-directed DNA polymerase